MASGNFARGFLSTFGPTVERQENKRQDSFRLFYSDYLDRRQDKEKLDRADAQKVKTAQAITERYDVPEGTWTWVYKQLDAGIPVETITSDLETGKFNVTDVAAGQVSKPPVQQQTDQMLGKPEQLGQPEQLGEPQVQPNLSEPQPQPQQIAEPDPLWRMKEKFRNLFNPKANQKQELEDIILETARVTGATPEQIKATMQSGYKSSNPDLDRYQVNAQLSPSLKKGPKDYAEARLALSRAQASGNPEAIRRAEEALAAEQEAKSFEVKAQDQATSRRGIMSRVGKETRQYTSNVSMVKSSMQDVQDMINIVDTDPAVTAKTVSKTASLLTRIGNELTRATELLKEGKTEEANRIQFKISSSARKSAEALEKEYNALKSSTLGKKITDLETASRLLEMKSQLLAYKIGVMYGQENRAISETERKMFQDMAQGGLTPQTFLQNVSILLTGEVDRLDYEGNALNSDFEVQDYNERFPEDRIGGETGLVGLASEEIMKDPVLNQIYERLKQNSNLNEPEQEQSSGYQPGYIDTDDATGDKYEFIGGDPIKPENWKKL